MQNKELVKNWTFYTNTTDIFVDVPTWERWELGVQKLPDFHNSCLKLSNIQTTFFFLQLLLNRQQRFNPETRAFLRLMRPLTAVDVYIRQGE